MKKLLSTITVISIVGILAAVGFFGYNKYQEVELEKHKLKAQQKENDDNNMRNTSELSNNENQSNESQNNRHEGGSERTANKNEFSNLKVNRDNVFDYVIAAINQNEDGDASSVTFQQPEFSAQGDGIWKIAANNKSGHGSYTFIVNQDGTVQIWNGLMNEKYEEKKVTLK